MVNREFDPTQSIVDIETFGIWVRDFRNSLIGDVSVEHRDVSVPPEFSPPGEYVKAYNIPWFYIPPSIQDIMALKYESVENTQFEKSVDIGIYEDKLTFSLNSPLVVGNIDMVSETYCGDGIDLFFGENEDRHHNVGKWDVSIVPAEIKIVAQKLVRKQDYNEDYKRVLARTRRQFPPVTLPQMHDTARLLTKARPNIIVTKDIPI